jgi:RimJ/RimL family protein N-acetyltransferase
MRNRLELVTSPAYRATGLVVRPATPTDAPRLVAMFERCSPETRYARFLAPLQRFPAAHLVDVVQSSPIRRSWVIEERSSGQVVGIGSWFRNQTGTPDAAEVGLLVEDAFQHRGLGAALLDELAARACDEGITVFVAETLAGARHVHRMLQRLGVTTIEGSGTSRSLRTVVERCLELQHREPVRLSRLA